MSKPQSLSLFSGTVRHRRFTPVEHEFVYTTSMLMLDLDDLGASLKPWPLASDTLPSIAWFRRKDYCGEGDLKAFILQKVEDETGIKINGKVWLLTNLRYWGALMNPIAIFYCYDDQEQLQATVFQVTNTPWGERIVYVLPVKAGERNQHAEFDKNMHVSPFNPMQMKYHCDFTVPDENLVVHLENHMQSQKHMDATLVLQRQHQTTLTKVGWFYIGRFPESIKTWWRIHKNAFKLWRKSAPIYDHPGKRKATSGS